MRTLAVVTLATAGCTRADPARDEATRTAQDRTELERLITVDLQVSRAMKDADDAVAHGNDDAALATIAQRARPAIATALGASDGAAMKTAWGKARREDVMSLLRERSTEMPRYEAAVKSGEPAKMLGAIEAQAEIERRALATVAAVKDRR